MIRKKNYVPRKPIYSSKILAYLRSTKQPADCKQILKNFRQKDTKVHQATVYRALNSLVKDKQVMVTEVIAGIKYYQVTKIHSHYVHCDLCQDKFVVSKKLAKELETALERVQNQIQVQNNFQSVSHLLQFSGVCKYCTPPHNNLVTTSLKNYP